MFFAEPRGRDGQIEEFDDRRALRAFIRAFYPADVVRGDAPLLVRGSCKRDDGFFFGDEMLHLDGVAHGVNVERGSLHFFVDDNSALCPEFQSRLFREPAFRQNADGENEHICDEFPFIRLDNDLFSVVRYFGDVGVKEQIYAVFAEFCMDKRGDIFIDGTQKMSAALDNGDVYAAFRQVFRRFQPDESTADDNGGRRCVFIGKSADFQRIFHRAQGKNPVAFTIVRRQNGVRARREDKFVVMRFKRFARA